MFQETCKVFSKRLNYILKFGLAWFIPAALIMLVLSFEAESYVNLYVIYTFYVAIVSWLLFRPILIQNILFGYDLKLFSIVPDLGKYILRSIVIFLYSILLGVIIGLIIGLVFALLGVSVGEDFPTIMFGLGAIIGLILVIFLIYYSIKCGWALINVFTNKVSTFRILMMKLNSKDIFNTLLCYIPMLILVGGVSFLISPEIEMVSPEVMGQMPEFYLEESKFYWLLFLPILTTFLGAFAIIFICVFYKEYIMQRLVKMQKEADK